MAGFCYTEKCSESAFGERGKQLFFAKDAPKGKTHILEIRQKRQQDKWDFTTNFCKISTEIPGSSQTF